MASSSRDAVDSRPVSRCDAALCTVGTDLRPRCVAVWPRQCTRPQHCEKPSPPFGKAAYRDASPRCRGTGPSRGQMSSVDMNGECPPVVQVCRELCARCLRRLGRHAPFLHPGSLRSPWLARRDRCLARVALVHRLSQHHLAPPSAEGCGSRWCCSVARPKKQTPTSLPATSAFFHHQEGSTSWTPPCCWQGAHLLTGSTMVIPQQASDEHGSAHVGCLPGYRSA